MSRFQPGFLTPALSSGPAFEQAVFSDSIIITNELPADDTIPQISEGAEILSLTIKPQSASSRFLVEATVFAGAKVYSDGANGNESRAWVAALFRGSNCIDTHAMHMKLDDSCTYSLRLQLLDEPATSSSVTWSVRVGPANLVIYGTPSDTQLGLRTNGVFLDYQNGINTRLFGGSAKSTLTIQELP